MNTVDKISGNTFFFKDVIVEDTPIKSSNSVGDDFGVPTQYEENDSDIVKKARQKFIEETRNAWKGGSNGE